MTVYEQFQALFLLRKGEEFPDQAAIEALLMRAETDFYSLCNREDIPIGAEPLIAELMLIHLNRIGAEGEISRKEGDISYTLDSTLPQGILLKLKKYNKGKVI